ncbi:MAG: hypothetical protein A2X36_01460 [Elusimicrobia bacterium GWA2_69_24]|nr:MAG: hypothetical protein A2X36_01460 [Elusimicrobia bacterium GWA2_69_24]HBL17126.1 hypothetical protein [Elusimicrobiota bacterium]
MKYWLFQSNQVVGPFDREELSTVPGFTAESLVCPEGRKGTHMGDWQRAGVVAELAETLLRMARVPAGVGVSSDPGFSTLPPEPTLRDLAVLGTLQEKVGLLENALSQLQDELQSREEEISSLKVELDQRGQDTVALQGKVGALEERLGATEALKEDLAHTQAEQSQEAKTIEELRAQLDSARAFIQENISKVTEGQVALRQDLRKEIEEEGGLLRRELKEGLESAKGAAFKEEPLKPGAFAAPAAAPEPAASGVEPPPDISAGEPEAISLPSIAAPPPTPQPIFSAPASGEAAPADVSASEPPPLSLPEIGQIMPADEPPPALEAPPSFAAAAPDAPAMELPSLELPGEPAPAEGEASLEPADAFGVPPPVTLEPPQLDSTPLPSPTPLPSDMPPVFESLSTPVPSDRMGDMGAMPMPAPMMRNEAAAQDSGDIVDLMAVPEKKRGKKGIIFMLLLLLAAGGAGAAYQKGLLKPYIPKAKAALGKLGLFGKKPAAQKAPEEAPAEAGGEAAPMDPQKGLPDRTQEAIDFVRSWPVPGGGKSLGEILEFGRSSKSLVSPWNLNPLGGDKYEVSFYSKSSNVPDYQFEVLLDAKQVRGLTSKSEAVLNGAPPAASGKEPAAGEPRKRKPRPRAGAPKGDGLLNDLLGSEDRAARPEETAAPAAPEGETVLPPEEGDAPKAGKRGKKGRAQAPADKPKEEKTLDELLLPETPE